MHRKVCYAGRGRIDIQWGNASTKTDPILKQLLLCFIYILTVSILMKTYVSEFIIRQCMKMIDCGIVYGSKYCESAYVSYELYV